MTTAREIKKMKAAAAKVTTVEERGAFVWSMGLTLANLKHDNIAEMVRTLLDSEAWRSYTYRNGDHYEFLAREFDYFLAQIDIDPRMVADAAVYTGDNELRALLVESSLDKVGDDRRSVEDIVAAYPLLAKWLEKYGLRTLGTVTMYESPDAIARVRDGGASKPKRWKFQVDRAALDLADEEKAQAIVQKLQEVGLYDSVVRLAMASRTCRGCPREVSGKSQWCSNACRMKASRRKAVAS